MFSQLRQKSLKRHLVKCPHCGLDVLDHMTVCPFCEGTLQPLMRQAAADARLQRTRAALRIIGFAIAALLVLWRLMAK